MLLVIDSSTATNAQNTEDFVIDYRNPIKLPANNYELALVKANLWYSWYNVSAAKGNNILRYNNGTITQPDIVIPDGQYTIDQINTVLQAAMLDNGDFTVGPSGNLFDIKIEPNYSTLRVKLTLTGGYELDLSAGRLYLLLGGDPINYTASGDLPEVANINDDINSLSIRCDIVSGMASYSNSDRSDIIYTFVPQSIPGTNIDVFPSERIYLPININDRLIKEIRMRITDNLGRSVVLNGEPVSYLLHLRPIM